MFFLMRCHHHDGMDDRREAVRAEHKAWVASAGDGSAGVLIGSATVDPDGKSTGNWGVLEAKDAASARAFAEGDPFNRAGIVSEIDIIPLPDTFQAYRIAEPMSKLEA